MFFTAAAKSPALRRLLSLSLSPSSKSNAVSSIEREECHPNREAGECSLNMILDVGALVHIKLDDCHFFVGMHLIMYLFFS